MTKPNRVLFEGTHRPRLAAPLLLMAFVAACSGPGKGADEPHDSASQPDAVADRTRPADAVTDAPPGREATGTDLTVPGDVVDEIRSDVEAVSMDVGAGGPPRTALLLDFEMRHPGSWRFFMEELDKLGVELTYRRWFPHLTEADVLADEGNAAGPYRYIFVCQGSAPGIPGEMMRPGDVDNLLAHHEAGGTAVLLTRNTWRDAYSGETDWFFLNRFLEAAGLAIRSGRNTLIGMVSIPPEGKPPLHTSQDWGYPGTLEWSIGHPIALPSDEIPGFGDLQPFAAGVVSSLACDQDDAEVLAWSHSAAIIWRYLDPDNVHADKVIQPFMSQPLVVIGPPNDAGGMIAVMPRGVFQVPAHTEDASDKPILDLNLISGTAAFAAATLERLLSLSEGKAPFSPNGCISPTGDKLFSATAQGFPALGEHPTIDAMYAPPQLPVAAEPPSPPEGAGGLVEELPARSGGVSTATPAWYPAGRARFGYMGVQPYEEMVAWLETGVAAGINSYVVTVPAGWLVGAHETGDLDPGLGQLADAALETGAVVFLGVNYLAPMYGGIKEEAGEAMGAQGQVVAAPPPLSSTWWEQGLSPMVLGAAEAAKQHQGIAGVHFDLELYGAGALWFAQAYIFDLETWGFVVSALEGLSPGLGGEATALEPQQKMPWLVDRGLTGFVYSCLEQEIASRAAALRVEARALKPDFELAFYNHLFATGWFYRGLMKGWGTAERPVTHLSYDMATNSIREVFNREGIHVRVLAGVLGVRFTPGDLETALYNGGLESDGYWLFQIGDFPLADGPGQVEGGHGDAFAYWESITAANLLLDDAPPPP